MKTIKHYKVPEMRPAAANMQVPAGLTAHINAIRAALVLRADLLGRTRQRHALLLLACDVLHSPVQVGEAERAAGSDRGPEQEGMFSERFDRLQRHTAKGQA